MDSAKLAFQAQFYKNDLMMSLGTDTRPPVLIDENEFTQWQDRFLNFIEQIPATPEEVLRMKADRELSANLMLALPNSVYNCPEWNKTCHRLKNDVRVSTMQIQELYEILMTDESLVLEKKAKLEKKNKKSMDPVELLMSQLDEQAFSGNAYNGATDDDGETLEKAMILLSQHYQKKFQPQSGSNNLRFTSGSKVKMPEPKSAACYNCGKSGHFSKECRVKKVKDSTYYRKKLELAEKRENGTALLAEEEFWLDHSDDEAANVEITQICLVGDDQSDNDSESDEDEYAPQFKIDWMNEKQVLEIENKKRTNNKKKEILFVYTSENAKYFPEKSRRGRKILNDISPVKSSISDDFVVPYTPNSDKENISPIIYDSKKYTLPLVLESKIIDLEDKIEDQNILREIESDIILSFMTSSLEENLFSQKQDSVSNLSFDFKENKREVSNFKIFSQNNSDSEVNSDLLVDQIGCLGKIISSDLNIKSKVLDDSFTLNDDYYKPKRKRRRSKKSKKQDTVISDSSNSSDSNFSDRTLSKSSRQIWRVKRTSTESMTEENSYVDRYYKSDSFAVCKKNSKYSIKQMIQISKNVSCSSSDSSSDDYAFSSSDDSVHSSQNPYFNETTTSRHVSLGLVLQSFKLLTKEIL
ncbi:hypothetical protein L6452_37697 [Arctium lappa]|uniref:Uncharacterized protein n=1 Tax=Arctium lappa TaxID=4217 RepID=A0ACB8Y4D4_ARCLA|nr:hypothetical protein L6452_37697 [Arctium lappa]